MENLLRFSETKVNREKVVTDIKDAIYEYFIDVVKTAISYVDLPDIKDMIQYSLGKYSIISGDGTEKPVHKEIADSIVSQIFIYSRNRGWLFNENDRKRLSDKIVKLLTKYDFERIEQSRRLSCNSEKMYKEADMKWFEDLKNTVLQTITDISKSDLQRLVSNLGSVDVRKYLAERKTTPKKVLEKLLDDPNVYVRELARDTLITQIREEQAKKQTEKKVEQVEEMPKLWFEKMKKVFKSNLETVDEATINRLIQDVWTRLPAANKQTILEQEKRVFESTRRDIMEKYSARKPWRGKDEKPPKGAEYKAPKEWWDKMVKKVKEGNPDYTDEQVARTVGDIWDNKLSEEKRREICKRYGKKPKSKRAICEFIIQVADQLDQKGYYKYADVLDGLVKQYMQLEEQ